MPDLVTTSLPAEQQVIRAKCFHPFGKFEQFPEEDVEKSVPERFEKIVCKYPDRIAVKIGNEQVTYDEMNKAANRLAHAILSGRGKGQELVTLFFPRGISLITAYMAVLKAGKVALHLDSSTSRDRFVHTLAESGTSFILTSTENRSFEYAPVTQGTPLLNIDELNENFSTDNPSLPIAPDARAYLLYTSGSTGSANGVAMSHRYTLHRAMSFTNSFRICSEDRLAILAGNVEKTLFNAILNGATICPAEKGLVHMAEWLIEEEITIYESFPTAFRQVVSGLASLESFPKLRLIRLGGEPLYKNDVELYKKYFSPHCLLVNSYSSTETATICLYFIEKDTTIAGTRIPIGYPVEDMDVLLLDELGKEVGTNEVGEIAVKSQFLSSGYWQRAKLTGEKFLSEPNSGQERVFLTGDLGRISSDGCLEHLGRKDSRVKIRSFRVDIGEVEATLVDHPGVKEAAVIAKETQSGDTRLLAYLVPKTYPPPTVTDLRNFFKTKLPDYMIPSTFMTLEEMPLTRTGKVNRRALPHLSNSRPELGIPYMAPTTPVETELGRIWAGVLCLDQVGIHDNFFDLGGHSLAATRVVSQVIKQFQLELPLHSLFQSPTVAEMAIVITKNQAKKLDETDLHRILAELESLSDDQAEQILVQLK